MAVLKIFKSTSKGLVDILNNGRQAAPIPAVRFGSNGMLDLAQALLAGPTPIPPPCPGQVSLIHRTRPSMHSVTIHLTRPAIASPLPAQRDRPPRLCPGLDFALGQQAHRYVRLNRVCHFTDCMFASGCSPPPLAAAQLPLATRERASPGKGTFTPLFAPAPRRTVRRQRRGGYQNEIK